MASLKHYGFVEYATQGYTLLVSFLVLLFHNSTVPHWEWIFATHIGILCFIHLLVQANERFPSSRAVDFLRHYYPIGLYLWFFSETGWLNRMFFPEFMDPAIIQWEQALFGCQPSTLFMQHLPYLPVSEIFYASYFSYYIMITGVGLALYLKDKRYCVHYISVISFVFYICYTIYIILPIIGPRVFFHEIARYSLPDAIQQFASTDRYPEVVQSGVFFKIMAFLYQLFESPGSALPSSHVAIALTTVFFSFKYLRPIRYVHLVVAILLCLSTVYCRYHYVIDVICGVITAALLVPLGNWLYFRISNPKKNAESSGTPPNSEKETQSCFS